VRLLARERPRRIVYPRSDQAGSALGRRLRGQGHEVLDLIAYRTGPPLNPARHRPRFAGPCTIIVTSPSAVSNLRRELSPLGFQKLRSTAYALVLGVRTARAMRGHGFRDVHVLAGDNTASEGKRPFAGGVFDALQQAERTNA
jgi:uroporphyrinogen-III synthase